MSTTAPEPALKRILTGWDLILYGLLFLTPTLGVIHLAAVTRGFRLAPKELTSLASAD